MKHKPVNHPFCPTCSSWTAPPADPSQESDTGHDPIAPLQIGIFGNEKEMSKCGLPDKG